MRLELASELETTQLGRTLAEALVWPFVLFLKGDLGAGKTTLMRGLVQSLGHEGRVKSPTYGIAETYAINEKSCVHMDLYRIADPDEIEYLGVLDNLGDKSLLAVEWPEKGAEGLPAPDLELEMAHLGEGRVVTIRACSTSGKAVYEALLKSHF